MSTCNQLKQIYLPVVSLWVAAHESGAQVGAFISIPKTHV
ncbi:hypothetical protein EYZ11_000196 [Aspergillus tanneri]|uniref:Uncharacterized protein n=1 Tax=Aspergillus tanneri TaxID=1220188 RepID=A0A4S3JXP6_9EURO|nr:hypothetical protein EYZ11_000196 [Aspergillus tanneri]